jgi:cysteine desulfurase/selenocysteine lyase
VTLVAPAFPALQGGLAYLDSAATSQTPLPVIEAMDAYYREYRASVHRGVYPLAARATEAFEGARVKVAELVGSTPGETVFTKNATEALNLAAHGQQLTEDDLVVITEMEHHSNIVSWQLTPARLEYVRIHDDGTLDLEHLDELLELQPKVVAFAHASNVLGTINPVEEITRRAHAAGAVVVVDGSQAVPHMPVDVGDVDFYAWTGHKAYGPTGIGVLHGKRELLERMPPLIGGGHMIQRVERDRSTWAAPPSKFEAGTSNIAEAIGLGAACDFLNEVGTDQIWEHNREIAAYALGPAERIGVVSFVLDGVHPHDVAEILGRQGVCVRAGHHCAQILMKRLGTPATSRASFAIHSTREDVDRLIDGLDEVRRVFA